MKNDYINPVYITYDVKPDCVSMAKALGGGMPIAAMCTSEKLMNTFGPGAHGTTFGGNPVAAAAAIAEIHTMIDKKLPENAKKVGEYFRAELAKMPHVKEVRGLGQLNGVEFDSDIAAAVKHESADRHFLLTVVKPNVIRMVPPLIASEADCDQAVKILTESIKAVCGE